VEPRLTLFIPTKNRSAYLCRLLGYYERGRLPHVVIVGDSSDADQLESTRQFIHSSAEHLKVELIPCPGMRNFDCARYLLDRIATPYAVWVADDDFVTPAGLDHAIDFLDRNPDYIAAHGESLLFGVESDQAHGRVNWLVPYPQTSIEHPTPSQRLEYHLEHYRPTAFSVHRTSSLRRAYQLVVDRKMYNIFGEFFPSCLPIIEGKTKRLDVLYMARQAHAGMTSTKLNADLFDWVTGSGWLAQWIQFRDSLAEEMASREGLDIDTCRDTVKKAFWYVLGTDLANKWKTRYRKKPEASLDQLKARLARYSGLRRAWESFWSVVPGEANKLLLPALLRKSSPYHSDFMPVYRAIRTL
jgi:glycosyltransferase domain-containing protein